MPRKNKTSVIETETNGAAVTTAPQFECPACKSKISGDGKTLHSQSSFLENLIEQDKTMGEVEQYVKELEEKTKAMEAELTQEKQKNKAKPEEKSSGESVREKEGEGKTKRGDWW